MSAPLRTGFRPQIVAERGVVATQHPVASALALGVLMRGGNAVDAAVTAAIALSVLRPDTGGPGGDVFALVHWARDGRTFALNASGPAPSGTDPDRFRPNGVPRAGILSACLPGAVAAWAAALERFGTLSLAEAAAPAIELAERGIPAGFELSRVTAKEAAVLAEDPAAAEIFLPGGKPPGPFHRIVQKSLAETLRRIGQEGSGTLYKGAIGDELIRWMRSQGGWFAPEDLGRVTPEWGQPLSTDYRGHQVLVVPPVSQAHILLAELNMVADDDLARLGHNSADAVHLMVEAKKLAFGDREQFTGDPARESIPIGALVSMARGRRLRAEIGPTASEVSLRRVPLGSDTTYLAVVDGDGNAVSFIQSLFHPFGCARVAGSTGIVLNNRMLSFSLDPGSPNRMEAGRRPVTTLAPSMVLQRGRPRFVVGSPGGDAQVQAVFQVIVNLLDHRFDVQPAVDAPRWRSQDNGKLAVETRIAPETIDGLRQRGHGVIASDDWTTQMGGVQLVAVDAERGWLLGGADPRREGYAVGY
jgi:gamma-glutamyltranspeptidase/glutathione hydrolase